MIEENIIFGKEKGKEYSMVSREVEQTFRDWIDYAGIDIKEFERRIKLEPHRIEDNTNVDEEIEINIYAGDKKVIVPLICKVNNNDCIVNVLLLLCYISSRYESQSLKKAVTIFAKKMMKKIK